MTVVPIPVEQTTAGAVARWDERQVDLIKQVVAPECSDEFLAFFAQVCAHRQLDPFAGEICAVPRRQKVKGRRDEWETVHTIQVTVDGYRAIAERSGLYGGQDAPQWCGPDGVWRDVWLEEGPPAAARVAVYRLDWSRPVVGIARYASYVQLGKSDKGEVYPKALWATGPDFMLSKCAESQALKRAFPRQLAAAGIAVREELTLAQRVAMEARQLGMGDDDRHAMMAELTEGRTESTREATEGELLAARARLAATREQAEAMAGPPPGVDAETGEIMPTDPSPSPAATPPEGRSGVGESSGGAGPHRRSSTGEIVPGAATLAEDARSVAPGHAGLPHGGDKPEGGVQIGRAHV